MKRSECANGHGGGEGLDSRNDEEEVVEGEVTAWCVRARAFFLPCVLSVLRVLSCVCVCVRIFFSVEGHEL